LPLLDIAAERLLTRQIETRFESLPSASKRALNALEALLQDAGCQRGHLFLFAPDALFEAASIGAPVDDELLRVASKHVTGHLAELTTVTEAPDADEPHSDHLPVLLVAERDGAPLLVGLALLSGSSSPRRAPQALVARAIAQALWTAGDSVGRQLSG
jgi:GAF domain-containing protein